VAETAIYNSASVTSTISVGRASQTITFEPPYGVSVGDQVPLTASATSGGTVIFAWVSGPATLEVSTNTLTVTGNGPVVIEATQGGNNIYAAAPPVQRAISSYPRSVVFQTHPPGTADVATASAIAGVPRLRVPLDVFIDIPELMNDVTWPPPAGQPPGTSWPAKFVIRNDGGNTPYYGSISVRGGLTKTLYLCDVYVDNDLDGLYEPNEMIQHERPIEIVPFSPAETDGQPVPIGQPIATPPAPAGVSGGLFAREALRTKVGVGFESVLNLPQTGLRTVTDGAGVLTSIIPELPGLGAREPWTDEDNYLRIAWRYADVLPGDAGTIEWFGANVSYEIGYDEGGDAVVIVRDPSRAGGGSPLRLPLDFDVSVYAWDAVDATPLPGNDYQIDPATGNMSLPHTGRLILVFDPTPLEPQSGDETYQTVVAVDHESELAFNGAVTATPIGTEIPVPEGTVFGTVEYNVTGSDAQNYTGRKHAVTRDPNAEGGDVDTLDLIYGIGRNGGWRASQIIPVNLDRFEVWWNKEFEIPGSGGLTMDYPSIVRRFSSVWPEIPAAGPAPDQLPDSSVTLPGKIVIASGLGSKPLLPADFKEPGIYYQNNPALPGFNPNDEHAVIESAGGGNGEQVIYALRDDLGRLDTSEPYVLVHYREPGDDDQNPRYRLKVIRVVAEDASQGWTFNNYTIDAGQPIVGFKPLSSLIPNPPAKKAVGVSGTFFPDRNGDLWAAAAGDDGTESTLEVDYFYLNQTGFYYPAGVTSYPVGAAVPLLDNNTGNPRNVTYTVSWPTDYPTLPMGDIVVEAKNGIKAIAEQDSVQVIYEQGRGWAGTGPKHHVDLIDYAKAWVVRLADHSLGGLPADVAHEPEGGGIERFGNVPLPPALGRRIFYRPPPTNELVFVGEFFDSGGEQNKPWVLLNVITPKERELLLDPAFCGTDRNFLEALTALCDDAAQIITVPAGDDVFDPVPTVSFDSLALTAGFADAEGFVTLAFNNDPDYPGNSVSLQVIRVVLPLARGAVHVFEAPSFFSEQVSLFFTGDLAGRSSEYEFEWKRVSASAFSGHNPTDDASLPGGGNHIDWLDQYPPTSGLNTITIGGPGPLTLSDNYFTVRYRPLDRNHPAWLNNPEGWSQWTTAQLVEGWIKRVGAKLGSFGQRFDDLSSETLTVDTRVSMISRAGPRWEGDIPLTDAGAMNAGLIEGYETILRRGSSFSIDVGINDLDVNIQLMNAAGRIADLYMLLGNEAYADAADPTLSVGSDYASTAGSLHAFMNITGGSTLLEEELSLLRGRDDVTAPGVGFSPCYNRLLWNFPRGGDGEVAYVNNYGIRDHNDSGKIDEEDARIDYPQGHGDAWGHYLSAIKNYYRLLRNENFTWQRRSEQISLGGVPTEVDYLDERNFAKAAALRAQTGAEIVSLTYRDAYKEDPALQWQGYKDSKIPYPDGSRRAWGVDEWGARAGQGAYLDWVVGNALLKANDSEHSGIQKIDRTTVPELRDLSASLTKIQTEVEKSNSALNPLGLLKEALPLYELSSADIDAGRTLFEKAYEHAITVLNNALAVFNRADGASQQLREQADELENFQVTVEERERDFRNRLIELYGYPYSDDIGGGRTYPAGYNGPDIHNHAIIDPSELLGVGSSDLATRTVTVTFLEDYGLEFDVANDLIDDDGVLNPTNDRSVTYNVSLQGYGLIKPASWTGSRLAQGKLQVALSGLVQARAAFERAVNNHESHLKTIVKRVELLETQLKVNAGEVNVLYESNDEQSRLNDEILASRKIQNALRSDARFASMIAATFAEALPTTNGMANDFTSLIRSVIRLEGNLEDQMLSQHADRESLREMGFQQAKERDQAKTNLTLTTLRAGLAIQQEVAQIESLLRDEAGLRLEAYTARETMLQAAESWKSLLASGNRLLEERLAFRRNTAANVQSLRYKDMAFRISRNDALEKFRAQFDVAAAWVYQAARAYDFDTNFPSDGSDPQGVTPGAAFLESIVKARAIGEISPGGQPVMAQHGADGGLASPMASMIQSWTSQKGPLGYYQAQTETLSFSLRRELLRIPTSYPQGITLNEGQAYMAACDRRWRETLQGFVVPNIRQVPEIVRHCSLLPGTSVEPAIVIPFSTTIEDGLNFFGWPGAGGESSYSASLWATKIQKVGVWFSNYPSAALSITPRVFLVPVGTDIMRTPGLGNTREWRVLEQVIPTPQLMTPSYVAALPGNWVPVFDGNNFIGSEAQIRKFGDFLAHYGSAFDPSKFTTNSRLIGRSAWNTRWLLVIRGRALWGDDAAGGVRIFIDGVTANGAGVKDILLILQTYALDGNYF
jgi:hypothetical protein